MFHNVGKESSREEDELKEHVEESQILPDTAELVPGGAECHRHVYPVDLVVHGPGEAEDSTQLEEDTDHGPDHPCVLPGEDKED